MQSSSPLPLCTRWQKIIKTSSMISFPSCSSEEFFLLLILKIGLNTLTFQNLKGSYVFKLPIEYVRQCGDFMLIWHCNCMHSRLQKMFTLWQVCVSHNSRRCSGQLTNPWITRSPLFIWCAQTWRNCTHFQIFAHLIHWFLSEKGHRNKSEPACS